jgi:uncharacterized SAM-binding protein YcdF (DUF218 family)
MPAGTRRAAGRLWIAALLLVVILATVTGPLWLPAIGRFLVVSDPLAPASAIMPLGGGGASRVAHAATLHGEGYAEWMVVADSPLDLPGLRTTYAELMRTEARWQGVPDDQILTLAGLVETTAEEADAAAALARERGWQSLIVVTDPYHTRRARLIFRRALRGSGIGLSVQPTPNHWYQPETWWRQRDSLRETWNEYLKLALFWLGYG